MTGWLLSKGNDLTPKGFSGAFGEQMVPVGVVAEITLFIIRQQCEVKHKQRMPCPVITLFRRYSEEHKPWWLSLSAWAAIQKVTDWGLTQQKFISHGSGGWNCKIGVWAAVVSPSFRWNLRCLLTPKVFPLTVFSHGVLVSLFSPVLSD